MSSTSQRTLLAARAPRLALGLLLGAVMLLTALVYSNSFGVPFLFDDGPAIVDNPSIRNVAALGDVLAPPVGEGITVGGRPLLNLSFALNYAFGELRPSGYHATNLLIHLLAGLTLFGVARATFRRVLSNDATLPSPGLAGLSTLDLLAVLATAWWLLHPLQTAAVTYIVQRAESLATLFYLGALAGLIRATEGHRPRTALTLGWLACFAGVLTKEIVATAPLLLFLYDRTFLAGSFRAAWQKRKGFYLALTLNWLVLGALVIAARGRGGSAGVDTPVETWHYLLTQAGAIWHYLRLALWPVPLVFDYGVDVQTSFTAAAPAFFGIVALLGATAYALWKFPRAGFASAAFFLLLAPSSSFVPVASQTIAEHRMYLPLGVLAVTLVWALQRWTGRIGLGVAAMVSVALGFVTYERNADYVSEVSLWTHTVQHRPQNARAHNNLGVVLQQRGDHAAAQRYYAEAIRLRPDYSDAQNNLGQLLFSQQRVADALPHFEAAVASKPRTVPARLNLANALLALGRARDAEAHFRRAVELAPESTTPRFQLGNFLLRTGQLAPAAEQFGLAAAADPTNVDALANHAQALLQLGRPGDAVRSLEAWLQHAPASAEARVHLATALTQLDRTAEAETQLADALRLQPTLAEAHVARAAILLRQGRANEALAQLRTTAADQPANAALQLALAQTLTALGQRDAALAHYDQAIRLAPEDPAPQVHRGNLLLQAGQFSAAIESFRTALRLDPSAANVHHNLALALMRDRRAAEALLHFEAFLRANPDSAAGHFNHAIALAQTGQIAAARTAAQNALRLRSPFPEAEALLRRLESSVN